MRGDLVSDLYLHPCIACKQRKTTYEQQGAGNLEWEGIAETIVSVPDASAVVDAHEEDTDATRAELCRQVAHAARKVHREVYLSPPSAC